MASIFKRRKGKNEPYTIQYVDHLGKRRTEVGFTDKGLTEQLAAKFESEARLRKTGLIDVEAEKIHSLRLSSVDEHLTPYLQSLQANDAKYVADVKVQIKRLFDHAKIKTLAEIDGEKILASLQAFQDHPRFGAKTYNHHLQSVKGF